MELISEWEELSSRDISVKGEAVALLKWPPLSRLDDSGSCVDVAFPDRLVEKWPLTVASTVDTMAEEEVGGDVQSNS